MRISQVEKKQRFLLKSVKTKRKIQQPKHNQAELTRQIDENWILGHLTAGSIVLIKLQ